VNNGFQGFPKVTVGNPVSNTLTAVGGEKTLVLGGQPISGTLRLFKNGLLLGPTAYSLSGRVATFTPAPVGSDVITVQYLATGGAAPARFFNPGNNIMSDVIISLSPTGYWKLNETSGTSAVDSSTSGNTGTLTNTPTLDQSPIFTNSSRSMSFASASSEHVAGAQTTYDSYTSAWTIMACVYSTSTAAQTIFTHKYGSQVPWTMGGGSDGGGAAQTWWGGFYNGSWRAKYDTGTYTTSTAYHLACTWNGTSLELYRNGSSIGTSTPGSSPNAETSSTGWYIGRRWDTGNFFEGRISDVAIFSTALSSTNISDIYAAGQ